MPAKRKNEKRKNVVSLCPNPQKSARIESAALMDSLEGRQVYARDINRLLSACSLVIVRGPIVSGKTYSVAEAACLASTSLKSINVNEDFDVKTLFGSYKCTDIPGEFVWTPSVFAKHLEKDGYIVLEELDAGSPDLVAALLTLCEKREYTLQNGKQQTLHQNCKILATVSSGRECCLNLIRDYPFFVDIPALNNDELSAICATNFLVMESIRRRTLQIFDTARSFISTKCASDRQLNAKDFFRLCKRFNTGSIDFASNFALLHEMHDVWLAHLAQPTRRLEAATLIGAELSLSVEQVNTLLSIRKPDVSARDDVLTIGHVTLPRHRTSLQRTRSFGMTRECCQLLERLARAVKGRESVLLTGETGVGKTSVVQLLADYCGVSLQTVNMSQDSEFSDLIGGFKPTPIINLVRPLTEKYLNLFRASFDVTKNAKILSSIEKLLAIERVEDLLKLIVGTAERTALSSSSSSPEWVNMAASAKRLLHYVQNSTCAFPFTYVAGVVTRAAEIGDWLLIDEINLSPPECLDAIIQVVDGEAKGVHPNFRLFACMNPATDVGKRFLSINVRSRFVEFFVNEPTEREQLDVIVRNYLPQADYTQLEKVWQFYEATHTLFPRKYSLRTLCRALKIVARNSKGNLKREAHLLSLAFSISFTSNLDSEEQEKLSSLVCKHFGQSKNVAAMNAPIKSARKEYIEVEGSFVKRGELQPMADERFIFTPSVRANLAFLASVVASGEFPILLEGETSAGKTSIIQHLAKVTGNRVHRINNHEHTDVQEYIGSYAPNASGHIEFVEGVLLRAVRKGEWIILDELNLAPSIVLEALNRLLDDNREIFVAELNETVSAHPRFRLFATQNPAGHYAGRKRLSAAFMNRFVILKYEHLPFVELPSIVEGRCGVAPSVATKMVEVLVELKARRSVHGIFSFSSGLMTLRDLFRWATRVARTSVPSNNDFDWRQIAAEQGYFVLASRCRNTEDEELVISVLETKLLRKIDTDTLFSADSPYMPSVVQRQNMENIVMTHSMRRMAILCAEAWKFDEAVLLVGETGCGKTTVVHILEEPLSINCHERTETSDFLGSIRPAADGKFHWHDGIVVRAMKSGRKLLVDEISLAPDSVLERLNSLLEADRSVLLTDGGSSETETIVAHCDFQFVGTMNPGDDHGKKELSKALRNRFLEVWCSAEQKSEDLRHIVARRLQLSSMFVEDSDDTRIVSVTSCLIEFFGYFRQQTQHIFTLPMTIRDLINIVDLLLGCLKRGLSSSDAIFQAVSATLFDAFGIIPARVIFDAKSLVNKCVVELNNILTRHQLEPVSTSADINMHIQFSDTALYVGPFLVEFGRQPPNTSSFAFDALTALRNVFCVARGLSSSKPIMLEGSPGAGKSSLIVALADTTGHPLVRLNLSEQTDLTDLFGGDVPHTTLEGTTTFVWRDGPILKAIKEGSWVLLDEMNLASQSVLEGLNSCFDFRKNLYISELNKTFEIESSDCRFFACQNPRSQGGDRKSLPKSFLNRFTSIYVNEMSDEDYIYILRKRFVDLLDDETLCKMVAVNRRISNVSLREGGPYEFNLRDLLRWASIINKYGVRFGYELVYKSRLRNAKDISKFAEIFADVFSDTSEIVQDVVVTPNEVHVGHDSICYRADVFDDAIKARQMTVLAAQTNILRRLAACVDMNWLALLIGDFTSCPRLCVENLAALAGRRVHILRLTAETDSLELLGSYEQVSTVNSDGSDTTSFQWIDSEFVKAYRDGHWILLQDVNCCSSSVLDCLNSCLEDGGKLVLPEHNEVDAVAIEKHPRFRVFFTMDPQNGSLSRAMRNRSVEIYVGSGSFWDDSLENHINALSTLHYRAKKEILNWIVSISLGMAWKESIVASAYDTVYDGNLRSIVDVNCGKLASLAKIRELFSAQCELSFRSAIIRYGVCYPFSEENEHRNFVADSVMEVIDEQRNSIKSMFSKIFGTFYAMLGSDFMIRKSTNDFDYDSISWIDGSIADMCLASQMLNAKIDSSTVYTLNLHCLLAGSYLSTLALQFWKKFGFSIAPERSQLCDLSSSTTDVKWLLNSYWKLLFTKNDVQSYLSAKLQAVGLRFDIMGIENIFSYSLTELLDFIKASASLLLALTPSKFDDTVALVLSNDLNDQRELDKLRIVEKFFDCLKRFLGTLGKYDAAFIDNLKLPILRSLWKLNHGATTNHDCRYRVFRPADQFFQHLARTLLDFTNNVAQFQRTVLSGDIMIALQEQDHIPSSQLIRLSSQIESFLMSVGFFTRALFSKYSGYPDIILPYTIALNVFVSGVNVLNRRVLRSKTQQELLDEHSFPSVEHSVCRVSSLSAGIDWCLSRPSSLKAVIDWCLEEKSSLPSHYQYQLVNWQIEKRQTSNEWTSSHEWIFRQWRGCHEKFVKKETESFVYKSRATDRDENDIVDEDKIEFNHYFPNYSDETLNDYDERIDKKYRHTANEYSISDAEIVELVRRVVTPPVSASNIESIPYFPLMKLMESLNLGDQISADDEAVLKYNHLIYMSRADNYVPNAQKKHVLDVYTENDYAEVTRCVADVERLKQRVTLLHDEFPENQVLANVLQVISMYLKLPPTTPLMRLTSLLEKLLGEADQWQQLADQKHSIRDETLVLQQILVDWRRLEVLCWADIVERVQREFRNSAFILAYPIIDTYRSLIAEKVQVEDSGIELPSNVVKSKNTEKTENKVLLMLMEWIHNASLVDFETRLFTGEVLARFVEIRDGPTRVAQRIRLLVNYFQIFRNAVQDRFANAKKEMEEKLKEFVEIFKFNDLNLWSVRQSTQKVHGQLFRIIKKFKEACREPVIDCLLEATLSIPPHHHEVVALAPKNRYDEKSLNSEFFFFNDSFDYLLGSLFDINLFMALSENAADIFESLQDDIKYVGTDEENKRRYKQEVNFRRKQFACLLRFVDCLGVSGRRGLKVNSEALTVRAICAAKLDFPNSENLANFTRRAIASRNIFRKRFAVFRIATHNEISRQVPIRRLSAMTEYGLFWLVNTSEALFGSALTYANNFEIFSKDIQVLVENFKRNENLQHHLAKEALADCDIQLEKILSQLTVLADVLKACPKNATTAQIVDVNIARLASEIGSNPLVEMTTTSASYKKLSSAIRSSIESVQRISDQRKNISLSPNGFWKVEEISALTTMALKEFHEFQTCHLPNILTYFPEECARMHEICEQFVKIIKTGLSLTTATKSKPPIQFTQDAMIQSKLDEFYVSIKKLCAATGPATQLDALNKAVKVMVQTDVDPILDAFQTFLSALIEPSAYTSLETLERVQTSCDGLLDFFRMTSRRISNVLLEFSVGYLHFENIAIRLISTGFVNKPPQADDDNSKSKAKESDASATAGENSGMGDANKNEGAASDAKDVADQLDETGQLEGLKEDQSPEEDDKDNTDSDDPIEMTDDFKGKLENLDHIDAPLSDSEEDYSENEDGFDWEKGDVDEPDERQLDPDLWDKSPGASEPDPADDEADGADKETDQMMAKDKKSAATDKKDDNQKEGEALEDEEDDMAENDQSESFHSGLDSGLDGSDDNEDENYGENDDVDELNENTESTEETNDEPMDVENDQDPDDNVQSIQNSVDETTVADKSNFNHGLKRGVGEAEHEDENTSGEQNASAEDQKGDGEKDEKKFCLQKNKSGLEKNEEKQDKKEAHAETNRADDRAERYEHAEIAAPDDELNRIDDRTVPPRQIGSDEEDIADEMDENGEDALAANREANQHLPARHIVQKSTVEEAEKTRDLYQRFDSSGKEQQHQDTTEEATAEETDTYEVLQFERHNGQDDDIVVISEHIRQMGPLADIEPNAAQLLEDKSTEEMDDDHFQSMELCWSNITGSVAQLASMLAESLRIIIEPTVASRLQGDYRTGKRLNVRRLISYVASDYRKDKIWMRRTKKVKRNYHIAIAVDDSGSMKDNKMSTITCHSLCLIEKALRQLEVGKLMVCKFGADVKVLSDFSADSSTDTTLGARLMSELTFAQEQTNLSNLLSVMGAKFIEAASSQGSTPAEQMLIILGDGRGVMTEGVERIRRALKRFDMDNITVLFIIIDNGAEGKSILDVKVVTGYERNENGVLKAKWCSYMEKFPFPFYVIVNGVEQLPTAISNAIQQWFEFTTR